MKIKHTLVKQSRMRGGFTLIEMLLVLVILATLAAVVLPKFTGTGQKAKITAAQTQLESFKTAMSTFEADNGMYPKSGDLGELLSAPPNMPSWHGPYLDSTTLPADPWGTPYVYVYPGKHNPNGYDLSSDGPDMKPGTSDDVANWDTKGTQ